MQTMMQTFTVRWELKEPLEPAMAEVWVSALTNLLNERAPNAMNYLCGLLLIRPLTIVYITFTEEKAAKTAQHIVSILDKNEEQILQGVKDGHWRTSKG